MSGHSKWHQIKRKKAVSDGKKAQVFAKLAKEIAVAARGGADPKANAGLARAITRAQAANMPKDNIERAIASASDKAHHAEVLLMEAYGPGGVGLLIRAATDSRNRTIAEIKHLLSEHQASLGGAGSVMWQFQAHGENYQAKQPVTLNEAAKQELAALLHELEAHEDVIEVTTTAA